MTTSEKLITRPLQYRDLEAIALLASQHPEPDQCNSSICLSKQIQEFQRWNGLFHFLKLFPNPLQNYFSIYVAEQNRLIKGFIQISPFNSTRSTWRVERVLVDPQNSEPQLLIGNKSIGSQLLRHCFETVWEARTWLLEVNVNHKQVISLYRENGFQPLAQMTYWSITPDKLAQLAQLKPDLPNLLPISNVDAQLLYQLDTVSMPPLLRQVFDRHIQDFKGNLISGLISKIRNWLTKTQISSGYVFEPQRKAAIGYFNITLSTDGTHPHQAQLTVHPAYTWLYPQLLAQMAHIVQNFPSQSLELASADYQPEREEYLSKLGANPIEHTLVMSRSVWHKLREAKPLEALQLSEVLQGLQPARTPIPSRMSSLLDSFSKFQKKSLVNSESNSHSLAKNDESDNSNNGQAKE